MVEHTDISTAAATPNDNAANETPSPTPSIPEPLQIVSIGTADDKFAFTFHEEKLNEIMQKIPPGWKVAVVSVVGAFRTGKVIAPP